MHTESPTTGDTTDEEVADSVVVTDRRYGSSIPVTVRIRRRARRTVVDDQGAAVRLAGRPAGWLERAELITREAGVNVNRRGVVHVPTVGDRNLERLTALVAATSLELYSELLD